jgi:hypothetical protein
MTDDSGDDDDDDDSPSEKTAVCKLPTRYNKSTNNNIAWALSVVLIADEKGKSIK